MAHDPALVEKVRVALENSIGCAIDAEEAAAALDAIDASGTHWVAPWEITKAMLWHAETWRWAQLRDACLEERGEQTK